MPLVLCRVGNETWRDAAVRQALPWHLEVEVAEYFDKFLAEGRSEADAAFDACWEWDVLGYEAEARDDGK